jgi:hypothetical protein
MATAKWYAIWLPELIFFGFIILPILILGVGMIVYGSNFWQDRKERKRMALKHAEESRRYQAFLVANPELAKIMCSVDECLKRQR